MRNIICFASHAAWGSQFAIFDTPLRWLCRKKIDRFAAEGSKKSKMCFPCSVRNTFFCASHGAWEAHFWNRLDPYGDNDIFLEGVNLAVHAVLCIFLWHITKAQIPSIIYFPNCNLYNVGDGFLCRAIIRTHIYWYIYICVCVCIYIYMYICDTNIHTYLHTHIYIYISINMCPYNGSTQKSIPHIV